MNPLKRLRRALSSSVSRRARPRRRLEIESLEQRLVLSGSLSINSVPITLNTPGPTSIAGTLNPGNEIAAYRIDGTAGEQLQFHSVSTSSTSGGWELIGENNQEVAGTSLGSDFNASLAATGPYYLELAGNTTTAIDYSFQITDLTTYPPIASSGFDTAGRAARWPTADPRPSPSRPPRACPSTSITSALSESIPRRSPTPATRQSSASPLPMATRAHTS